MGKSVNRKRNCPIDLLILRKVLNSLMVTLFISRLLWLRTHVGQAPLSCDLDLDSISAALSGNLFFPWQKSSFLLGIKICDFQEVVPSKY